jgi:hypothetical protein
LKRPLWSKRQGCRPKTGNFIIIKIPDRSRQIGTVHFRDHENCGLYSTESLDQSNVTMHIDLFKGIHASIAAVLLLPQAKVSVALFTLKMAGVSKNRDRSSKSYEPPRCRVPWTYVNAQDMSQGAATQSKNCGLIGSGWQSTLLFPVLTALDRDRTIENDLCYLQSPLGRRRSAVLSLDQVYEPLDRSPIPSSDTRDPAGVSAPDDQRP